MAFEIINADCLEALRGMPDASVDSIVTDPPYGLSKEPDIVEVLTKWLRGDAYEHTSAGFMGKTWDSFVPGPEYWRECFRVLKPGGHLLAFSGTRTQDLMCVAIRLGGFEIRDSLSSITDGSWDLESFLESLDDVQMEALHRWADRGEGRAAWLFGSGFPKSHNVSKAIDKMAGADREVLGDNPNSRPNMVGVAANVLARRADAPLTAPATDSAKRWDGWGTALKPAHEPIVVARKPFKGAVAANVLEHGTGALNIDGCRVPSVDVLPKMGGDAILGGTSSGWDRPWKSDPEALARRKKAADAAIEKANNLGRWPANILHDGSEAVVGVFPVTSSGSRKAGVRSSLGFGSTSTGDGGPALEASTGSASRYFYCAKASKRDRDEGLSHLRELTPGERTERKEGSAGINPYAGGRAPARNAHPTVKPTDLMRHLVRMVTPPGGVVLDPFCGSGSTGKAAILEGFDFVGIEREPDYARLAEARCGWAAEEMAKPPILEPVPVEEPVELSDEVDPGDVVFQMIFGDFE